MMKFIIFAAAMENGGNDRASADRPCIHIFRNGL